MNDLSRKDILDIFRSADKLHRKRTNDLAGKNLAMIFAKPSTRTRVSFEVAMNQLGGNSITLNQTDIQLGTGETIADTARVLSRYVDGITARLFAHKDIEELAKYASVPVINALTDLEHPCQALTDLYTIRNNNPGKIKLVLLGDGANNTFHSLIIGAEKLGIEVIVGCPPNHRPKIKGNFSVVKDPSVAVINADVVYTDTFVSMGQDSEKKKREKDLRKYQVNNKLLQRARKHVIVMHPLPAHRGMEITSDIMDGKRSAVFDQAENRLHVQKAVLKTFLKV
jgi:ornithine carbamoyltransferase